jgi:DNA-binding NarL/FixJ family response regulator
LQHLLEGDAEKQVALKLGLSPHTVHEYVKVLYRKLEVSSRSELLARFIGRRGLAPAG